MNNFITSKVCIKNYLFAPNETFDFEVGHTVVGTIMKPVASLNLTSATFFSAIRTADVTGSLGAATANTPAANLMAIFIGCKRFMRFTTTAAAGAETTKGTLTILTRTRGLPDNNVNHYVMV